MTNRSNSFLGLTCFTMRTFIISIEFVVAITGLLVVFHFPRYIEGWEFFCHISGAKFHTLCSIPSIGIPFGLKWVDEIQRPDHKLKGELLTWPGYKRLKITCYAGLFYLLLFAGVSFTIWCVYDNIHHSSQLITVIFCILGALVALFTLCNAKDEVHVVLQQYITPVTKE